MEAPNKKGGRRKPRARTPEQRENELINMAYDFAEKLFAAGSASSQITTHFLQLGTQKAMLEREKTEYEIELLKAKTDSIRSSEETEKLYREALKAMSIYRGDVHEDGIIDAETFEDE